ncbi:MAG: M23 family metallopeptidase [Myxococcota bacterium]|nr:M23 family metallopeptidase [Myxococcota bacterium]
MIEPDSKGRSAISLRAVALGLAIGLAGGWWIFSERVDEGPSAKAVTDSSPAAEELAEADPNSGASEVYGPTLPPDWEPGGDLDAWKDWATEGPQAGLIAGQLGRGESLTMALGRYGISERTVALIAQALKPHFDFRRSRPGDRYRAEVDERGQVVEFFYVNRPDEPLFLSWDGEQYLVKLEKPAIELRRERIAGVIDSSLYDSVASLGEDPQLANSFSELFALEMDFTRSVQLGDSFSALYERRYQISPDGQSSYAGLGRILAAHYDGAAGEFTAVYYKAKNKPAGYYRTDGTALEGKFLFKPVEVGRISSDYRASRRHPILKFSRPHRGIDWAAPRGTPVWSVASGTIIFRGYAGSRGFGNLVKVRHDNGYISYYGHLEGFAGGQKVGDRVQQKQVVGYVGSTGLATGPHTCFRIKDGKGQYVNPMKVKSAAGARIAKEDWSDFQLKRDELLVRLNGSRLAANEAKPSS